MLDTLVAAVGPELADAVALALALDPRDRYQTAREMGRAIERRRARDLPGRARLTARRTARTGDRGDEPAGDGGHARIRARAGRQRRCHPPPPAPGTAAQPGRRCAAARPPPRPSPGAGRGAGGCCSRLLVLLALAVVIVAVVIATAPAPTKIVLRNVVYADVQQASSALKQLVSGKHQRRSRGPRSRRKGPLTRAPRQELPFRAGHPSIAQQASNLNRRLQLWLRRPDSNRHLTIDGYPCCPYTTPKATAEATQRLDETLRRATRVPRFPSPRLGFPAANLSSAAPGKRGCASSAAALPVSSPARAR